MIGVTKDVEGGKKFKDRHKLSYDIWIDPESEIFDKFVDKYIPYNAIIGPDGKVAYADVGFDADSAKKIKGVLDGLLKK